MKKFPLVLLFLLVAVFIRYGFTERYEKITIRSSAKPAVKKPVVKIETEKGNLFITPPPPKARIVEVDPKFKKPDDFGKYVHSQKGKAAYEYTPPKKIPKAKAAPEKKKPVVKPKPKSKQ